MQMPQCDVAVGDCYRTYCNELAHMSTERIESDCQKFVGILTRRMEDLSENMNREPQAVVGTDAMHLKYYNQNNYKPVSRALCAALIQHIYEGGNFEEIQGFLLQFEQTTRAYLDMLAESDHTFIVGPYGEHAGMRGEEWRLTYATEIKSIQDFQNIAVLLICAVRKELVQRKRIEEPLKGH